MVARNTTWLGVGSPNAHCRLGFRAGESLCTHKNLQSAFGRKTSNQLGRTLCDLEALGICPGVGGAIQPVHPSNISDLIFAIDHLMRLRWKGFPAIA